MAEETLDINAVDSRGRTRLMHLCAKGASSDEIKTALDSGADMTIRDRDGLNARDIAANRGHDHIVTVLDGYKPAVDAKLSQEFLEAAAKIGAIGDFEKLHELVAKGVNPNCTDAEGRNAFLVFIDAKQAPDSGSSYKTWLEGMFRQLLVLGVDPLHKDVDGRDALTACRNRSEVMKGVFEGAQKSHAEGVKTRMNEIMHNIKNLKNYTAAIQKIMENTALIRKLDGKEGWQLVEAAMRGRSPELLNAILDTGINPNLCDGDLQTGISWACRMGYAESVPVFLSHGADPALADKELRTTLHWAAHGGNIKCVTLVLDAAPGIVNNAAVDGTTPIMDAERWGGGDERVPIVKLFKERGADINAQDNSGRTLLIRTCDSGNTKNTGLVKAIISMGAQVDQQDTKGNTALIRACDRGHEGAVEALLDANANPRIQNKEGRAALDKMWIESPCGIRVKARLDELAAKEAREAVADKPHTHVEQTAPGTSEAGATHRKRGLGGHK
ncbi:MAG: ankyrin repeat domain-containing protein [Candidatus Burarchaeum sp.]|nr:ankyrin repeat domain-containing protein [Candidatus Burarchaeum sp.]MDO8339084.1 ankyrin repeat domain-containing protein [Candidatus Burarchaeum sp.]